MTTWRWLCALLLLAGVGLAEAQTKGGTVRITIYQEPETLHPLFGTQSVNNVVLEPIVEGLLQIQPDGEFRARLAAEVPTIQNGGLSRDGKTLIYKLRRDVQWSDGRSFTSADVKFTYDAIMHPSNPVSSRAGYDKMRVVETPDAHSVVVRYAEYDAAWPTRFASIVPRHLFSGPEHLAKTPYARRPVGTGPFLFRDWATGSRILLERNPGFREEGKPLVDRVVFQIVPSPEVATAQLKAGATDVLWNVRENQLAEVENAPGIRADFGKSPSVERVQLNMRDPNDLAKPHPILGDLRVRQALQLATPKRQIVDELLKGGRASVAVAHVSLGPFADQAAGPSPYEPSRAAALLDEAGWKPGADGVRVKEGKRLELTVSSTPEKHRELTQQLLQSVWRKIGVDLKIKNYPSSTLLGSWSRNGIRGRGRFDLIMFAASAPVDPLGYYATRFTAAGIPSEKNPGGYNFNGYSNPKVEALVAQASSEVDRATRRELYLQISRILNADVETILLYNRAEASVYSARLQGLVMHPWENLAWNIADWSFRQ